MPVTADDCPICTLKMIMPTAVTACGHKFCFLCIKGVALLNNGNHSLCPMCRGPVDIRQFTHVTDRNLQITMQDPEDDAPKTPPPAKLVPILTIKKEIKSEPQDREYTEPQQADNKDGVHKLPAQTVLQKQKEMDTTAMSTSAQKPNTIYWVYRARSNGWWRYDPRSEKDIEAARRLGKLSCEVVTCGMTFVVDFQNMKQFRKDRPDIERDIARIDGDQCLAGMNIRGIAGVSLS